MQDIDLARAPVPDLHARLAEARRSGPVVPVCFHGRRAWLTTTWAETRAALADEDRFPSASIQEPLVGKTMQSMVGGDHRRNRALIASAFTPRSIGAQEVELLEPLAHELIDGLATERRFDLVEQFAHRYPALVITRLLGIPVHDEALFLQWGLDLFLFPWNPEKAKHAWNAFRAYLAPIVQDRRERPGPDLLSALVQAELEGERLADDEIFSFLGILYPAGADTAYKAIASMMAAVLRERAFFEGAQTDVGIRASIADETLRWEAPVALLPRRSALDTRIGEETIAKGDTLLIGITAANRDPAVFAEPERFDPERRALEKSLVFGHGPHFCLGAQLARAELRIALGTLAERLPSMRLEDPADVETTGAILRGPRRVIVRI
jgi:cytochrome P450